MPVAPHQRPSAVQSRSSRRSAKSRKLEATSVDVTKSRDLGAAMRKRNARATVARSRAAIDAEIGRWIRDKTSSPPASIDLLLTRPIDAILMGLHVAVRVGQIPRDRAAELSPIVREWKGKHQ